MEASRRQRGLTHHGLPVLLKITCCALLGRQALCTQDSVTSRPERGSFNICVIKYNNIIIQRMGTAHVNQLCDGWGGCAKIERGVQSICLSENYLSKHRRDNRTMRRARRRQLQVLPLPAIIKFWYKIRSRRGTTQVVCGQQSRASARGSFTLSLRAC